MPDFGSFRGFSEKLTQGQTPTQLGLIGSESFSFDGLLDAYPNAEAAFSIRQLRKLYSGNCLKVRRSSDSAEQDIGFTSAGELNTTALLSFVGSGNGFITTWYDQSGNENNATQPTASYQPQIVSSGNIVVQNSKPTIQFARVNKYLLFSQNYTFQSIFSVFKFDSASFTDYNGLIGTNTMEELFGVENTKQFGTNNGITFSAYENNNLTTNRTFSSINTQKLASFIFNSSKLINQTTKYFGAITNPVNRSWDGNMQEFIIYSTNKSTDLSGINTAINTYYAIY